MSNEQEQQPKITISSVYGIRPADCESCVGGSRFHPLVPSKEFCRCSFKHKFFSDEEVKELGYDKKSYTVHDGTWVYEFSLDRAIVFDVFDKSLLDLELMLLLYKVFKRQNNESTYNLLNPNQQTEILTHFLVNNCDVCFVCLFIKLQANTFCQTFSEFVFS